MEKVYKEYPDVQLSHMYVNNAAMQIIRKPEEFDVILTSNMFGDILSDEAAVLGGSLGLLPSASIRDRHQLCEPIHGSAPDIAGQGIANPIGLILSVTMMFQLSFKRPDLSKKLEKAVLLTLEKGFRTKDIFSGGHTLLSTEEMGKTLTQFFKEMLWGVLNGIDVYWCLSWGKPLPGLFFRKA